MKLSIAPEVAKALAANAPVVALESTVIAHGLPRPRNLTTARALETEIRALGVVPATIALHDGVAVVGAGDVLLERLANETGVAKVSIRDIAPVLAARNDSSNDFRYDSSCSGVLLLESFGSLPLTWLRSFT